MNISYLIYEAERPRTMAEQREADMRAGELAAAAARLGRALRHPFMGKLEAGRKGQRPAKAGPEHSARIGGRVVSN